MRLDGYIEIIDEKYKQFVTILGTNKFKLSDDMIFSTPDGGAIYHLDISQFTEEQFHNICSLMAPRYNMNLSEMKKELYQSGIVVPVTSCLMHSITDKQISVIRKNFKNRINIAHNGLIPDTSEAEVYWVSLMIISLLLGEKWRAENFNPTQNISDKRMEYLNTNVSKRSNLQVHQFRTVLLADCLFKLQNVDGFQYKLKELRELSPKKPEVFIEDIISELLIPKMLIEDEAVIKYIKPSRKKGNDYDIEITFKNGIQLGAEIKCKREDTAINPNSLKRKLKKAIDQFPKNMKCIIFVKIPKELIYDKTFRPSVESFLETFYKEHPNLSCVILVWEESLSLINGGGANFIKSHIILNRNQIFLEVYLKNLLEKNHL